MDPISTATSSILQTGLLGALLVVSGGVIVYLTRKYDKMIKDKEEEIRQMGIDHLQDWKSGAIVNNQLHTEVKNILQTLVDSIKQK